MSLGKKLFLGGTPACTTDTVDKFGDSSGVALYSLDYDASDAGGNYNGTPSNVAFGVDGQINYGTGFNGTSSYITADKSMFGTGDGVANLWSISLWFKTDGSVTASRTLVGTKGNSIQPGFFLYMISGGQIRYYEGNTSTNSQQPTTTASYDDGNWHNVVMTRSGTTDVFTMYIDGAEVIAPTTMTNPHTSHNFNLHIGRYPASAIYFWDGTIDQVRIFNKTLSSSEVSTLYAETACVYTSTTDNNDYPVTNAAYYKLDNNAEDAKGNYDGTESNITYEFGRFGQAAVFNGSSSKITTSGLKGYSEQTWSFWINPDVVNSRGHLMGTYPSGTIGQGAMYVELRANGNIEAGVRNSGGSTSSVITTTPLTASQWYYVAVTSSGSELKLYINGANPITTSATVTTLDSANVASLAIGYEQRNATNYFDGSIDQVRIFDSALDATAIESLYNEKPEVNTSNFETVLWNGNGVSQYISSLGFEPDFVWIKKRGNDAKDHRLFDTVRGPNKVIYSSRDLPEGSPTTELTSFEANGFMLGSGSAVNDADTNDSYVAWCWKAGGDAVNNTDGNITSQVSANQDAGFSIVKWTSTGSGNSTKTVGHGLSSAPDMIILKNASATSSWRVYHSGIPSPNNSLALNSDEIAFSFWPSVSSTNFGLVASVTTGESSGASGQSIIAYCLHSVTGYQKMGVYTGNSNNSGPIITTGFRPRFVMVKGSSINKSWRVQDDKRGYSSSTGVVESQLEWNTNSIEGTGADRVKFTDTGFQIVTSSAGWNSSGQQYIYLAIA